MQCCSFVMLEVRGCNAALLWGSEKSLYSEASVTLSVNDEMFFSCSEIFESSLAHGEQQDHSFKVS